MRQFVAVVLACLLVLSTSSVANARRRSVSASGEVTCDGQPMPYVTIKLMDKDVAFDDTMGTGRALSNGKFTVTGNGGDVFGDPDPYILVEYKYSGTYGDMSVTSITGVVHQGKSSVRRWKRFLNFGTLNFASIHCRAYIKFYEAIKDYKDRSQNSLPYSNLKIETNTLIHGGAPYATTSKIRIPRGYQISERTAKHELAHTIRHTYDGSLGHFLVDVARFKYMQHHSCDKQTNRGFAFNEGWAEYWAGSCYGSFGNSPQDYQIEGNVASALRSLQSKCGSTYNEMVQVLSKNRGRIHSFDDYNNKHDSLFNCKL